MTCKAQLAGMVCTLDEGHEGAHHTMQSTRYWPGPKPLGVPMETPLVWIDRLFSCPEIKGGKVPVPCERGLGHKGAHQGWEGQLCWPNEAEPLEGQGFFCHVCPPNGLCPTCEKPSEP